MQHRFGAAGRRTLSPPALKSGDVRGHKTPPIPRFFSRAAVAVTGEAGLSYDRLSAPTFHLATYCLHSVGTVRSVYEGLASCRTQAPSPRASQAPTVHLAESKRQTSRLRIQLGRVSTAF